MKETNLFVDKLTNDTESVELIKITSESPHGQSSSDTEAPHIHSGRYWFEMAKNPSDFKSTESEETNLETFTNLPTTCQNVDTNLASAEGQLHKLTSNAETDIEPETASKPSISDKKNSVEKLAIVSSSVGLVPPQNGNENRMTNDSDDDVIEVKLPPLPIICIDSSDDESFSSRSVPIKLSSASKFNPSKNSSVPIEKSIASKSNKSCVSPVPSVMSSTSDDFLQNECTELIFAVPKFNFNLHGSDLASSTLNNSIAQLSSTPRRRTKKKQSKTSDNSEEPNPNKNLNRDGCFATPKNKIDYTSKTSYVVDSTLPIPCSDIYESESADTPESVDVPIHSECDDTNDEHFITLDESDCESYSDLVVANVSGVLLEKPTDLENTENDEIPGDPPQSEKTNEDSDRIVLEASSANVEVNLLKKYYDESWGGENFDHKQIMQSMPGDKYLWNISSKDLYAKPDKRRQPCNFCNQYGHRSDFCKRKPKLCFMCGQTGHTDWNCPHKLCLQCGAKSNLFINSCRQCYSWRNAYCDNCKVTGHPTKNCADSWRRYHLTTTNEIPLIEQRGLKPKSQQYCSGCAGRSHVVSDCKNNVNLILEYRPTSVYIQSYEPLYTPDGVRQTTPNKTVSGAMKENPINKRKSESNDKPMNKRKSESDLTENPINKRKTECTVKSTNKRKSESESTEKPINKRKSEPSEKPIYKRKSECAPKSPKSSKHRNSTTEDQESSLLFGKNLPENTINKNQVAKEQILQCNQVLQDCNVSNSSDAVFKQSILLAPNNRKKLETKAGQKFLEKLSAEFSVQCEVNHSEIGDVLYINGITASQNSFLIKFRDWLLEFKPEDSVVESTYAGFIPRKCNKAVQKLSQELKLLDKNYLDPWIIFNRMKRSKQNREMLLKQIHIHEKKLSTLRRKINQDTKLLNMILIGQAGLAGGKQLLEALVEMVNQIKTRNSQEMTTKERTELGHLYGPIFSFIPRYDYYDLLKEYGKNRQVTSNDNTLPQNNKEIVFNHSKIKKNKSCTGPPQQKSRFKLLSQVMRLRKALKRMPFNCNINNKDKKKLVIQLNNCKRMILMAAAPPSKIDESYVNQIINVGNEMVLYCNTK